MRLVQWFGPAVRVERFDEADGIRFRVTSGRRPADLVIPLIAAVVLIFAWQLGASGLLLLGAGALIGFPLWRWFDVRSTELRVTELDLVAEGDLDTLKGTVWVQWTEIHDLRHGHGGEDNVGGLYADSVCLVPGVSETQVEEMLWAVYRRFPFVRVAERRTMPNLLAMPEDSIPLSLLKEKDEQD